MRISISPVTNVSTATISALTTVFSDAGAGNRKGWFIQNLGTNPLYVQLGTSASTSSFHFVLKGGTGNDDGLGASTSQTVGAVYQGAITIAGTTPRYTSLEMY